MANPLRVLAGASDSSDADASSEESEAELDESKLSIQPKKEEMSGSETGECCVVVCHILPR